MLYVSGCIAYVLNGHADVRELRSISGGSFVRFQVGISKSRDSITPTLVSGTMFRIIFFPARSISQNPIVAMTNRG